MSRVTKIKSWNWNILRNQIPNAFCAKYLLLQSMLQTCKKDKLMIFPVCRPKFWNLSFLHKGTPDKFLKDSLLFDVTF